MSGRFDALAPNRLALAGKLLLGALCILSGSLANAAVCTITNTKTVDVAALDQPVLFNRLGASNINGMIYALTRDLVAINPAGVAVPNQPISLAVGDDPAPFVGNVALRPDKRPRPLVLRIAAGDCLHVNFWNLLTTAPNQANLFPPQFNVFIDEQVAERHAGFHAAGMQVVNGVSDDGTFVGENPTNGTVLPGGLRQYTLYAEHEGTFVVRDLASTTGSDGNQGNSGNLLFGQIIVEPKGARIYRGQLTEEELRLASTNTDPLSPQCGQRQKTAHGQPIINYEATYPAVDCPIGPPNNLGATTWALEGKSGLPILNMTCNAAAATAGACAANEIVHSEINALVAGPDADGSWHSKCPGADCPYPLERIGKRNPSLPNRLEPFRDYASIFHDEPAAAQAFPGFYVADPVFRFVLAGVKDGFMINYGSGGIGSEIIANRLGVGPMHDCLTCAYEEFFLTSFAVGDPAQLVDVAANIGLEALQPGDPVPAAFTGPKATYVPYPDDPANVHHAYSGDFVKFRNVHVGLEQHVFHLHNHQWLYNPNDDNSNYLDAQGIGPGIGFTYEINYGGAGNRMKSTGDAIFHCHFYPHFAQGMWYLFRIHDVYETGTPLQASGAPNAFHDLQWELENGMPLQIGTDGSGFPIRARALPDGEIVAGAPIPAVVPLPGKAMPPLPGEVHLVANTKVPLVLASDANPSVAPGTLVPVGSLAKVVERDVHPGYPFWVAGVEDVVGNRPPTPPMDMIDFTLAKDLRDSKIDVTFRRAGSAVEFKISELFDKLVPEQADGFDGGLPRSALLGYAAGGVTGVNNVSRLDFSKVIEEAKAVFFPEAGTDVEHIAMAYHALRNHNSFAVDMNGNVSVSPYVLNGNKPAVGAPYHEPCMDDQGDRYDTNDDVLDEYEGNHLFWGASTDEFVSGDDQSQFDADYPRIYKAANMQFDAVLNKAGYHYPQQRIIALWEDVVPIIKKQQPPEPLVMRFNTFECGVFHHTNLVPENYELDDYQVRTPTDIIGQHIHLPKWDLTTADGAANGWNYEDGTLSPGAVQERITALDAFALAGHAHAVGEGSGAFTVPGGFVDGSAKPGEHPYFSKQAPPGTLADKWKGARTTTQRWFFDPVFNTSNEDRGLGIIFTHDHYGPSTHQQIGLYATVLVEPSKSDWYHNETGIRLGDAAPGENESGRIDGGPTSWQAMILPSGPNALNPNVLVPHREFYFEYTDFQHAYEAGIYVGADQNGEALPDAGPVVLAADGSITTGFGIANLGNPANCGDALNSFRCAINPPARLQKVPVFPDLVDEIANTAANPVNNFCPQRPCPQAIDVQDPGMFVVNYRNEPVGLRVYDPNKLGPDNLPGAQADGIAGDLAYALASSGPDGLGGDADIVRKFEVTNFVRAAGGGEPLPINPTTGNVQVLNIQPDAGDSINGTIFPPMLNSKSALKGGDPFTPMVRTMPGDKIRFKMQAGGDEEEHVGTVHGLAWLQAGSGFGGAPNSGWRNAQAGGISEQFTLTMPVVGVVGQLGGSNDHLYSMDVSQDGYWSGMWGLMRVYSNKQSDLPLLPDSPFENDNNVKVRTDGFDGVCKTETITIGSGRKKQKVTRIQNLREYSVTAVLANDILPASIAMPAADPNAGGHVGAYPNPNGGTLVYNSRAGGAAKSPIHDPTAILYVRTEDMVNPNDPTQGLKPTAPIEPLILRAAAGDCVQVTLRNRLLAQAFVTATDEKVIDAQGQVVAVDFGQPLFVQDLAGTSQCGVDNVFVPCTQVATADVTFDQMPDMATYSSLIGTVKRDRGAGVQGATTFQTNLVQASPWVGIHTQLVEFDQSRDNGIHAGKKGGHTLVAPGQDHTYQWYAGKLDAKVVENITTNKKGKVTGISHEFVLTPTPVEYGTANLQPADVIKQGMKSMVGQLVVEPEGSTWPDALAQLENRAGVDPNGPGRKTRAMVDVSDADGNLLFRDLSSVWQKGLTQYYANNMPVEHINGEGDGIPEDPQDGTNMAINYGIEPLWHRFEIAPNAPFGNAGALGSFGAQQQFDVFHNSYNGINADPQTPVFLAPRGVETRMRIGVPHGTNRGSTFALHGHLWQRDPYITEYSTDGGYPAGRGVTGRNVMDEDCNETGPGVGSKTIGLNPLGMYEGGRESIWPSTHNDIRLPSAGGAEGKPGDYLFRDFGANGNASGLWGILRVE